MRTDIERREVAYDAATGTLIVGSRSIVVACAPGDNDCLLRTYLGLVAEQREVRLGQGFHLRRDDIAVLAELLDLDDDDLEARLQRILCLTAAEAADLGRRLRRHKVAAAAVGVGLMAGLPLSGAFAAADERTGTPAAETTTTTASSVGQINPISADALSAPIVVEAPVEVIRNEPVAAPAPADEAPADETEAEVGYSVTYERDPSYVPEEGVEIGDSMVIERDPPPSE